MGAKVIVVGAGIGGMSAAITAAERGLDVTLVERGAKVGGAAAYSGGQVWIGGNHLEARDGIADSVEETMAYVRAAAHRDDASVDPVMCETWLRAAVDAALYLEQIGAIAWEIIPDYPDYYYPTLPGSKPRGRYVTGAPFDATGLGEARSLLHVSPHFPVGISYGEMFAWGGMSSKTAWDWDLVERRGAAGVLTFGSGIAGALFKAVLDRDIRLLTGHAAKRLLVDDDGRVAGLIGEGPDGEVEWTGDVLLATGAHDWSEDYARAFTGIPREDGGSVTPPTISGDAMDLVKAIGGTVASLPGWAAPVIPGYRVSEEAFPGDTRYRTCFEHCLPHTFLVNRAGQRFADDSFHSTVVAAALQQDAQGKPANLPIFMIWDSQHHAKYGLGRTMPGGAYPQGLVTSAPTLGTLAEKLGIDAGGLAATAARFNADAEKGEDAHFGRGSNLSVRRFRGDANMHPNPNLGPVDRAPFHGLRIRLLNSGIAAGGVRTDARARPLREDGSAIAGLYVVGEASSRAAAGVGYNSGYSLSRAMAFGWLAANEIAERAEG